MLVLFLLIAYGVAGQEIKLGQNLILAIISLSASYITATTINDITDQKIDVINHPKAIGRPLVSGKASVKDMVVVHVLAASITLTTALIISWYATILMCISLVINYLYSLPPFKLSYRTHFAHLLLSIAYVGVPYFLGIHIAGGSIKGAELILFLSLFILFYGRILLKDFRDRAGDSKYGKPTFLLYYGKTATLILSFITIAIGNVLLLFLLREEISRLILLQLLFVCIYLSLFRLFVITDLEKELFYISLGAREGNGVLLFLLSMFWLQNSGASNSQVNIFLIVLTSIFAMYFFILLNLPSEQLKLRYKG